MMRWTHFIVIQILLVALVTALVYLHKDRVLLVKNPPASLAQWYKPQNERQVWLHTMFNLRREMQAVEKYSVGKEAKNLDNWVTKFSDHYLEIAKMVPEWEKKLNRQALKKLQESSKKQDYDNIAAALEELNTSCDSCHRDYRSITAALYRAPDFTSMKLDNAETLVSHMDTLSRQVNQIKIASVDGKQQEALLALKDLKAGMQTLGKSCESCHKKQHLQYPSEAINLTVNSLEQSLKTGSLKDQGRDLGTLAVLACARCHGTHRIAYDSRVLFSGQRSLKELLKH